MSAERLREAAALMRERAEAASGVVDKPDVWHAEGDVVAVYYDLGDGVTQEGDVTGELEPETAEHIASWHPAVALTVADWLDGQAERAEVGFAGSMFTKALAVANAYLGGAA